MLKRAQLRKLNALVSAGLLGDAIAFLRLLGVSKGQSAIALGQVGLDPGVAKSAVHTSPVWQDRFESDSKFLESLNRALAGLEREGYICTPSAPVVSPVLPPAPDAAAYEALPRDDPRLAAGVEEIARRHDVRPASPTTRFADGSLPVFAVGAAHVVKLYPPCYAHELGIEASCLRAVEGRLGIPTPRVVATGELDGWQYLLMSRLHGESLAIAWPRIPAADRARLVEALGGALAALHGLPTAALQVPRPDWPGFVRAQVASATDRQRARGLGDPWLAQVDGFLAEMQLPEGGPTVLLHTEVMREHLLVAPGANGWELTGLFDFEPAMLGAADYEFASVGVFVTCGEGGLLRRLLLAYGMRPDALDEGLSRRFLAYALVHRYSSLRWYLERLRPSPDVRTLDGLARAWWPLA